MRTNFAFSARVVELANKHFSSAADARHALRKAIDDISDEQLRNIRSIQVTLMH
jgi:hypothetical protein